MAIKCFAYLRCSSPGQVEGDTFPRQQTAVRRYAAAHGLSVARWWMEPISGTKDGVDRPEWTAMLAAILANGVRTIIVENLGRLARHQGLQEYILLSLRRQGITVLSTAEADLDSADPSRVMIRQILGSVHQFEKEQLVLRTRVARQRIRDRGERCEGRKPYGQHPNHPREAITLARARELWAAGSSLTAIGRTLDLEGHTPRAGGSWQPRVLSRILNARKDHCHVKYFSLTGGARRS